MAFGEDISHGLRSYEPDVFLYGNYPGGVGLTAPLYRISGKLLKLSGRPLARKPNQEGTPVLQEK